MISEFLSAAVRITCRKNTGSVVASEIMDSMSNSFDTFFGPRVCEGLLGKNDVGDAETWANTCISTVCRVSFFIVGLEIPSLLWDALLSLLSLFSIFRGWTAADV